MGIMMLSGVLACTSLFLAGVLTGWLLDGGYTRYVTQRENRQFLADKTAEQVARAHVELSLMAAMTVIANMRTILPDEEQEYLSAAESGIGKVLTYYIINRISIMKDVDDV